PSACTASMRQARTVRPSTRIVQAPQTPCSHPTRMPVSPTSSLRKSDRSIRDGGAPSTRRPFTAMLMRRGSDIISRSLPSHHQISLSDRFVGPQLLHAPLMADHPLVDDVGAVTHLHGESDILLGEKDADAALLEPQNPLADRLDHERGQALGRLVEDQQARVRERRPPAAEESVLASAPVLP